MKFDCGETRQEKIARLEDWHDWFAWHPVRVGSHDCRWLEVVSRRGDYFCGMVGSFWTWEYRAINAA